MYYASKNNNVVCKESCRFVKKIKPQNLQSFISIEVAENSGKRKCKVCFKGE